MKKFIPYIFITAFIGTFLMLSFSGPFAGTFSGPQKAEAGVAADTYHYTAKQFWRYVNVIEGAAFGTLTLTGGIWGEGGILTWTIGNVTATISDLIFHLAAWLFNLSAQLLDQAIDFSVTNFKQNIEGIGVIDQGYKIVLNIANMLFIFILLYIAIKTILGVGGDTKKLLTSIIVVGLFINFSLFMTKTIIDASNIIAMGFYNSIQTVFEQNNDGQEKTVSSVAMAFTSGLKLQTTIYNPKSLTIANDPNKGLDNFHITLNFLGGAALLLVSAFVFLSVAILFIVRFIALLFYLIFSPVAFLGYISPSSELKSHSTNWWKGLLSQTMFAPAFLFIAYLISSIINSGKLWEVVGGNDTSTATFFDAIQTGFGTGFPIIMNYVILIALMIGGLITAKSMASVGSYGAVGYAQKFQGWAQGVAGRNTVGRGAELLNRGLDSAKERMEESKIGRTALGVMKYGSLGLAGGAKDLIEKGETTKFGSAESRKDIVETRNTEIARGLKDRRDKPERMAAYLQGLSSKERMAAYEKMSARDRAAVEAAATPLGYAHVFQDLNKKLSVEEQEKTDKAAGDAKKEATNKELLGDINRAGAIPPENNPATGAPYTVAEIQTAMRRLTGNLGAKLKRGVRTNPIIMPYLTVPLLADIMKENVLDDSEIRTIYAHVLTDPPGSRRRTWITTAGPRDDYWNL